MASQPPYYNTWAVPGPPPPPPPPHPAQQQPQGQPQPYSPYQPHQQYSPGYVPEPLPPQASPTGQTQYSTDPHCYSTNPPSSYQAHAAPVYGTASLPPPPPHQYHQQPHGQRNVYPPPPGPPRGPPVSTAASTLPHTGQSQQSNGGNAAQRPYFPPPPGPPPAQADAPVFSIPASGTPSSTGSRPAPPPPPLAHQRDAVPRTSPAASQQAAPAPPHRAASENSASALHGLVEDMANQLRRLEVQAGSAQPPSVSASPAIRPSQTEVRELSDEDFEFPLVSYSPPRASGPPNQVLQECPDSRGVSSQVVWYELPDARGALVCSHCYARHVANTSLVGSFERLEASGGTCRFNTARILLHLWPEAQRTRSTSALARFLTRRRQIPDCKGWTGVKRDEDIKFFSPVATPPTGFVACEACYEDHVAAGPRTSGGAVSRAPPYLEP
ncbi:hypothetical protein VTK73DRAFT_2017 [Phialemonium thermophilum]|uniref:GATA-type domain-containing protein n=1 Tax=Phialemonium thermophilum TaxID=223376 RepID=A0ABR3VSN9_9PEZI